MSEMCPVCRGRGKVPNGFYNLSSYSSTAPVEPIECRSCKGVGYISHYPAEVQAVLTAAEKLLDETTGVAIDLPIQVENGLEELYSTLKALKEK